MSIPVLSVLAFAAWTIIVLILGVGVHRWSRILTGRAQLVDWPADTPHGPERYRRIMRAHANCVENLPVFAAIVFAAEALQFHSNAFDALAVSVVIARAFQTIAHIASGTNVGVAIRFAFFAVHLGAYLAMVTMIALP